MVSQDFASPAPSPAASPIRPPAPLDEAAVQESLRPFGSSRMLPRAAYVGADVFAWEQQHFFGGGWMCVGRGSQTAAAGDMRAEPVGEGSVLIVRGDDGALRAFQNVCRHRGNSLCTGSGSDLHELRCGYHGWTWDLCGALKRIPNRKGFGAIRMSELPLLAVRVDTWERLVFVNLDAD
ncbi:MAG: aromatic ring-hydroxylating oxygenase subunit alpha, partial [Gemmatimonadales bacterium]